MADERVPTVLEFLQKRQWVLPGRRHFDSVYAIRPVSQMLDIDDIRAKPSRRVRSPERRGPRAIEREITSLLSINAKALDFGHHRLRVRQSVRSIGNLGCTINWNALAQFVLDRRLAAKPWIAPLNHARRAVRP